LVVWNMFFPHSVGNHSPNWRSHIFHMGRYTTHQKVPGLCNSQNETVHHTNIFVWMINGLI
jgi:hypothetical protein